MSWGDYLELEDPPGYRYEYEDGYLIMSPTGISLHDRTRDRLLRRLANWEEATEGRHGVVFAEHSFFMPAGGRDYRPDVAVITDARKEHLDPNGWPSGAPNLAIEVLSPGTELRDRNLKAARYYEQGADELWLVDARREVIEFYRRGDAGWAQAEPVGSVYETPLLPGFQLDLPGLWREVARGFR